MGKLRSRQDHELDRLIRGEAPSAGHLDPSLVLFVDQVRRIASIPPSSWVESKHMSAVAEATQLFVEKGEPATRPASKATGPDTQASGLPKRRRSFVLSSLFASLTAKLAAGGVAVAMAATGGLAANGRFPDTVQDKIAVAAEKVGIDIPKSTDEGDEESNPVIDADEEAGEAAVKEGSDSGKRSNADVHEAIDSTEPGPERGKTVSEAARLKPEDAEGEITAGSESKSVSAAVHEAIDSTEPGPERGKAVSKAASQNRHNEEVDEVGDIEAGDVEIPDVETQDEEEGAASDHPGNSGASKKSNP
jgi:hypothetical protein